MYVYIMTNANNTTPYTGLTNDLFRRVSEHKQGKTPGFTKRYNIVKLVYYERYGGPDAAIRREKRIKGGSRAKKIALIESMNPGRQDMFDEMTGGEAPYLINRVIARSAGARRLHRG